MLRTEQRYQDLFEVINEAVLVYDPESKLVLDVNGRACEMYGISREEFVGESIEDLSLEVECGRRYLRTLLSEGSYQGFETVHRRGDDTPMRVSINSSVIDSGGRKAVLSVNRDVTERVLAEEALKESERRYASLLANAPAYFYRCRNEPGWPNEFVSDHALELTGISPEDLVGGDSTYGELIVEKDRQRVWEEVQEALAGRRRFKLRYTIRHRDGTPRHVEERGQGVYGEGGEVVAIEGVVYDVTERVRVEEALRETEARYRAFVEQMPAITYVQDPQTKRITYVSPQIESVLGYPPEREILDENHWLKIMHPADRRRVEAEDRRTDETGEPFRMEYRQFARDGRLVWIRDEAALVRDEGGRPLYWLGVQIDVTERKRAEEEMREANRRLEELASLRGDFTAMVAHEIGSPLATVRGFLDVLATGELGPAERAAVLAKVEAEIEGLSTLVADVRSGSAIEREDFSLLSRRVSVGELLDDAARFAETLPGDHPLVVEVVRDELVRADPYRIGQVLRNLLSNAAKYSPEGAPVELRAARVDDHVRVEVADHGRGIHPDDAERIFDKFGRGRDRSDRKTYGVGLGLYLSRRIVRAHGGELTYRPAPDGGSVFSFGLQIER